MTAFLVHEDLPRCPIADVFALLREPDPTAQFAILNAEPMWCTEDGTVVVTGFEAASAALRSERLSSSVLRQSASNPTDRETLLLFLDPPEHTQLRRIVGPRLDPPTYAREAIDKRWSQLTNQPGDAVADVITPIALRTVCDTIGLPATHAGPLAQWARSSSDAFDPLLAQRSSGDITNTGVRSLTLVHRILRHTPATHGPVAALEHAAQVGRISETAMLQNVVSLISAGLDTTTGLISNAIAILAADPHLIDVLRDSPGLVAAFVDEVARIDSPVQLLTRRKATTVGNRSPHDEMVLVLLGCANRDPKVFSNAGRLDLRRKGPRHLGYGRGIHACLGATVAAALGVCVVDSYLEHAELLRINVSEGRRRTHAIFRSYDTLPSNPKDHPSAVPTMH